MVQGPKACMVFKDQKHAWFIKKKKKKRKKKKGSY